MPPISPIARKRNPSGICRNEIGPPPLVKIRSTDEPIKKVHSVARNGLIRSPTIIAALNSPTSTPPETPARHAAAQPAPKVRIATTAKAAPKSSAMPTDRSIPPLAATRVMPSATISAPWTRPVQKMFTPTVLKPTEIAVTSTAPITAPHIVTTRRGESAAPRKVASTISIIRFSSLPGVLPEPRASRKNEAAKPDSAAGTKLWAIRRRTLSPAVSAASRLPPAA